MEIQYNVLQWYKYDALSTWCLYGRKHPYLLYYVLWRQSWSWSFFTCFLRLLWQKLTCTINRYIRGPYQDSHRKALVAMGQSCVAGCIDNPYIQINLFMFTFNWLHLVCCAQSHADLKLHSHCTWQLMCEVVTL